MALYGVVYAVLENDIRRLLCYHIVSQVGYMVAGVGMGTALALNGSAAHAFCHILYKALLLMGAGAVIHATGRRTLTELGGIWRQMPVVVVLYFVGALSISGMPLFNGFISKSMIMTAAADGGRPLVELLLTLASVGTFLHTGLKLPYFMFFGPRRELALRPVPRNMTVAMAIAAACCFALGVAPTWLYARLPFQAVDYHPYTVDHVVAALQLLLGTGIGFWVLVTKLGSHSTISLDTDWFYRRPFSVGFGAVVGAASRGGASIQAATRRTVAALGPVAANPVLLLTRLGVRVPESPEAKGVPGRFVRYEENAYRLPIGVTVFWVVAGFVVLVLAVW
jgi:multicomponent Na+:H+ antiporter subunit D